MTKPYKYRSKYRNIGKNEKGVVLTMYIKDKSTLEQIAEHLNVTLGTVLQTIFKEFKEEKSVVRPVVYSSRTEPYWTENEMLTEPYYGTISIRFKSTELQENWKLY